jgi:integrase
VARKNGNGEGSRPRQRADGRWEARYWVGGKRRSVYGSTRKEAADRLARAVANDEEPMAEVAETDITVRQFFAQYDDSVRDTMKRRSLETYRDIARLHLLPAFGNKKLKDLTREHVQRLYSQKRDAGLSAARVRRIHGVLSSALNHALRWRLVDRNVCKEVSPPRVSAPVVRPFNAQEARRFLAAARGEFGRGARLRSCDISCGYRIRIPGDCL